MIADGYFQTRQRLKNVVLGALDLAEKTAVNPNVVLDTSVRKALSDPVLFCVYGEQDSGKTTLLNALVGSEVCNITHKKNPEEMGLISWYLYGKEEKSEGLMNDRLLQQFRPEEALKHFNLLDTPGSNTFEKELEIAHSLFPLTDVIFWVFSVANPWAASTWMTLSTQSAEILQKSVIVLQKSDLKQEQDIAVMLDHMHDLADQRLDLSEENRIPIFPVSADRALRAKTHVSDFGKVDFQLLQQSGMPKLESYITDIVENSSGRNKQLHLVSDTAGKVLADIEANMDLRKKLLHKNQGFLYEVEDEVEQERRLHAAEYQGNKESMRTVFDGKIKNALKLMKSRMSPLASLKSLFVTSHFSREMETSLISLVKESIELQVSKDSEQLVSDCRDHWETVRPRVKEQLTLELDDFDKASGGFKEVSAEFTKSMGAASEDAIVKLRLRSGLDRMVAERLQSVKKWVYLALICLSLAGLSGFLKISPYPYISLFLLNGSLIAAVLFVVNCNRSRRDILSIYKERLDDSSMPFADDLNADYKEGVHKFYIAYAGLLAGVRRHIINAKDELEPNLNHWKALFLELKGIEQDL